MHTNWAVSVGADSNGGLEVQSCTKRAEEPTSLRLPYRCVGTYSPISSKGAMSNKRLYLVVCGRRRLAIWAHVVEAGLSVSVGLSLRGL